MNGKSSTVIEKELLRIRAAVPVGLRNEMIVNSYCDGFTIGVLFGLKFTLDAIKGEDSADEAMDRILAVAKEAEMLRQESLAALTDKLMEKLGPQMR